MSCLQHPSILKQRRAQVSRYLAEFWPLAVDAANSGNYKVRVGALKLALGLPSTVAKLLGGRP